MVAQYLEEATLFWANMGVNGIRHDASLHLNPAFVKGLKDAVDSSNTVTHFGEFFIGRPDPKYDEYVYFPKQTGANNLDFEFFRAASTTFGDFSTSMADFGNMLMYTQDDYEYENQTVTFLDNHDVSRFGYLQRNEKPYNAALATLLTSRGIPNIYYGTEQYVVPADGSDVSGRIFMQTDSEFNTQTTAYQLIGDLSELRRSNDAKSLQRAVGLAQDGRVVPELLKAVFNTDSYVLSNKGDAKIREIQQALNGGYYQYTGINPCDGIYSRATNRALIYALQKEEGMSVDEATGSFLDRTFALCPTIPFQGSSSLNEQNITKIVQYALYANGFYSTAAFDGTYNASMSASIREFQAFMVLPVHDYANPSTIKALMASCGDVNRSCEGCDTATILTSSSAAALYQAGYRYVGRYLTGTVGGTRSKALTLQEAYTILDAGMKIIPIYQDGATYADYFTESRAFVDADAAYAAATALGLPNGTTVYFAVDVDLTDYQIQSKLID